VSSDSTEPDWSEPVWAASSAVAFREGASPAAPPRPEPGSEDLERTGPEPSPTTTGEEASPRRRRWPVVAGSAAAVVVLVAVASEALGRWYVASQVEDRLRDSGMTGRIEVTVGSSPWRPNVLGALLGRGLDELDVLITDGTVGGLGVSHADYRLSGIDGSVSIRSGNVVVESIERGDVRIEFPAEELGSAVGTSFAVVDGRLWAAGVVPWDRRAVALRVVDGSLELGGDAAELWGMPVDVPVADSYLLPCPPSVRLKGERLVLSCSGDELPGVLESPLSVDPSSPTAPVGELEPPQTIVRDGG